jgi:hypothetical protein
MGVFAFVWGAALLVQAAAEPGVETASASYASACREGAAQITVLDPPEHGFFSKRLEYEGIPIKAHADVVDEALWAAHERLSRMLTNLPSVRARLRTAGAALHIIGRNQVTTDLPEWRHDQGKPLAEYNGLTRDERTRGMGGLLASCGEENLLRLEEDRYRGRDICVHEFAHNILDHGGTPEVRQRVREQHRRSLERGLWVGAYAGSNFHEFFAELAMWYFGTHGDRRMEGPPPADGPDGLKAYDPEAFALLDDFFRGRLEPATPEPAAGPARLAIERVILEAAPPLPLSAVRLTGGPLKNAQDLNARILLALEPDRMLAGYRLRAGLTPKAAGYGGWDAVEGKQLTGHLAGHYLSGVSLMFAATGDPRFKERADALVRELKEVQDRRGNGYLGALTDNQGLDAAQLFEQVAGGDIRSGGFDLNGMWSPWYTLHKTYAGLRDAWRHTGNATALELEGRFAAWAESIVGRLTDPQVQRMLNTEFGGMNEIFADLYADTGDRRWLQLSYRFEHHAFTEPLKRHQDNLAGKHGNTQVPKLIGSLARFSYIGDPGDGYAASFFWDRVVQHHSYATGGHGKDEYFGEPDQLSERVDGRVAETCNVYNMLKLTRQMFALRPDAHYADFHERALFNHILASQDPQEGWACYMVPVGRGVQREYERNMLDGGFTCCTGSSLESHALHGHGLYYASEDTLWVNLYAPSTATWAAAGVHLTTETDFPAGESVRLQFKLSGPKRFTLALRRPFWTDAGFAVRVNDVPVPAAQLAAPGAENGRSRERVVAEPTVSWFVPLERTWENGDAVTVALPKRLRLEPLPDNPRRVALLWGPLVLAGDLGAEEARRGAGRHAATFESVPVFVAAERPVAEWLEPVPDQPGRFRTVGVGRDREVEFEPLYQLHRRTYAVYWDLFTPPEWEQRAAEIAAARERQVKLEAATVGFVQPGEMQAERDAHMQGEETSPDRVMGRPGRRARQWFSFDVPVDPAHPMALVVTYNLDEWRERTFDILIDGIRVGQQRIERRGPMRFFDVEYPIPAELVRDKQRVTVRFQATEGNEVGAVFGLRMIRADAGR